MEKALKLTGSKASIAKSYHDFLDGVATNQDLAIANRIYVRPTFSVNPTFSQTASDSFYAGIQPINFADAVNAAATMNDFVSTTTHGLINNLISAEALSAQTAMVLINAVYFKGTWDKQFNVDATDQSTFYSPSSTAQIDTMHKTDHYNYGTVAELNADALQMTYNQNTMSMVILLPKERFGITQLLTSLANYDLSKIQTNLKYSKVQVSVPKWKTSFSKTLNGPLQQLGMVDAFTNGANFNGLSTNNERVAITQVIQKAYIDVDEIGTKAAAATGVIVSTTSIRIEDTYTFNADHPFVYIIQNNAGDPYFMGIFSNDP